MRLTAEQVQEIEASASRYGCGAWDCVDCYPLEYSCDWCEEQFETPILNGQRVYCDCCGAMTNEWKEWTEQQLAFYTLHGQKSTILL